jgi:phosphohistidine phosphatase
LDLYLVRHAAAHERDPDLWPDDSKRPLTPEGEEQFRVAARGLAGLVPHPDALLSSQFERAWRTAEILSELDGWPAPEPSAPLEPTLPPEKATVEIQAYEEAGTLVVVGHRPCLHELTAYLLTGRADGASINIKKGGVVRLRFEDQVGPGSGELRWSLTPRILRTLGS